LKNAGSFFFTEATVVPKPTSADIPATDVRKIPAEKNIHATEVVCRINSYRLGKFKGAENVTTEHNVGISGLFLLVLRSDSIFSHSIKRLQ